MTEINVDSVLARMAEALDLNDWGALAMSLGKDEATFRVWRQRKQIPAKVVQDVVERTNCATQWLLYGDVQHLAANEVTEKTSGNFFSQQAKQVNLLGAKEVELIQKLRDMHPKLREAIVTMITHSPSMDAKKKR
jgi:Bacteriophage CI repressor helix-turn-helix domain